MRQPKDLNWQREGSGRSKKLKVRAQIRDILHLFSADRKNIPTILHNIIQHKGNHVLRSLMFCHEILTVNISTKCAMITTPFFTRSLKINRVWDMNRNTQSRIKHSPPPRTWGKSQCGWDQCDICNGWRWITSLILHRGDAGLTVSPPNKC